MHVIYSVVSSTTKCQSSNHFLSLQCIPSGRSKRGTEINAIQQELRWQVGEWCFKTTTSLHCFFLQGSFLLVLLEATYLKHLEPIKMAQSRKSLNVWPIILGMFDPDVYPVWATLGFVFKRELLFKNFSLSTKHNPCQRS